MASQSNEVKVQIGDEVRVLEGDDLIAFNAMRSEMQSESEARKTEAEARETAKTALLKKLGITTEEAALLLS